jgi:serine/threonine protein kinase
VERAVPSFAFYRVRVRIGHFRLTLSVLRHRAHSPLLPDHAKAGGYGRVHFFRLAEREVCLKSIPLRPSETPQKTFEKAVKEYSILKICAAMGCAPRLEGCLGFDVVVYDDCLQYAMERGRPFAEMTPELRAGLRQRLRLMHDFGIVHTDVKPENVVWSESRQCAVFIDFGFSEAIREPRGQKTRSIFKGTPNYASPPMLALMTEHVGHIDLYYNDAYALNLIVSQI